MKIKHRKKYYVGGLISLIFLPILFFISTTEIRNKAIHYGSIEVGVALDGTDNNMSLLPESAYVFLGNDETIKLSKFEQYCQSKKQVSELILKATLPDSCTYNFFVQAINILQRNKFASGIDHKTIKFRYWPKFSYQQEYESANDVEEIQYVYSKLSKILLTILDRSYEPKRTIRKYTYYDIGPPPSMFGRLFFPPRYERIKEEPRSSLYFRIIGLWFVPIIFLWILLFILSITRNRKLLPNQALKLTE
jgi:hypothetical protein